MPAPESSSAPTEPRFISKQVTAAQRYYLNLNPPRSAPLVVVCGGVERVDCNYTVDRADFPYCGVEFVAEGSGSVMLGQRKFRLGPGMAFAYWPGLPHVIRNNPRQPMRKYYVDFAGRRALELLRATPLGSGRAVLVAAPREVENVFQMLAREAGHHGSTASEITGKLIEVLLLKLRQRSLAPGRNVPRSFATFERVRNHIEANYLHLHTVSDVARECHVTPMYLARLFRRFAHTGAYQFLLRRKMDRAAELLMHEHLLVKETAAALNFSDPFHFSRAFKRVHGVSPETFLRLRSALRPARLRLNPSAGKSVRMDG